MLKGAGGAMAGTGANRFRSHPSCPWPLLSQEELEGDTPSRRQGMPAKKERAMCGSLAKMIRETGAACERAVAASGRPVHPACRLPARWGGRAHAPALACAVTAPVPVRGPPRSRTRARPRAGQQLFKKSNKPAWVTAVMFCRRYFAVKSLQRNDMIILGAAALHLAGKAEDDPQRLDKVIHQIFTYRRAPPLPGRRVLSQGAAGSGGIA